MSESKLNKIEEKVDVIVEKLHNIDKTLERNTASLEMHIKRTDLLEAKLKPVEDHVAALNGGLKALGVISLIVGIFAAIFKIISP